MSGWKRYLVDDRGTLRIKVDGIVSEGSALDWNVQPMVAYDRIVSPIRPWRQMWNDPPTEAELDEWVRAGAGEDGLLPACDPIL